LTTATSTKSRSLSVTTVQPCVSATEAMIVSNALRGITGDYRGLPDYRDTPVFADLPARTSPSSSCLARFPNRCGCQGRAFQARRRTAVAAGDP
jgi:hypothetical protein